MKFTKGILKTTAVIATAVCSFTQTAEAFERDHINYEHEGKTHHAYSGTLRIGENEYVYSSTSYLENKTISLAYTYRVKCDGVKAIDWAFVDPEGFGSVQDRQEEANYRCKWING